MNRFSLLLFAALAATAGIQSCSVPAQTSARTAGKTIDDDITKRRFEFVPSTASPQVGGAVQNLSGFALRVTNDTLVSYLPYYGRAYSAPIGSSRGPLDFKSTSFTWKEYDDTKGRRDIRLEFESGEVSAMDLSFSSEGYGTVNVRLRNRQPISFYGRVLGVE